MKLIFKYLVFLVSMLSVYSANAQKVLSEGSIIYDITVQTGSREPQLADMFDGATTSIYLKGALSRAEMLSPLGKTVTILDAKKNTGVILKEYGNQKLLIQMEPADWASLHQKYNGISFSITNETKNIIGYTCQKAIAKLNDGTSFTVFFSKEIVAENKDYDIQFKNLPGLPLEYESAVGNIKVRYTAAKISFDPVSAQRFAIPTSGYRQLTYAESNNLKAN